MQLLQSLHRLCLQSTPSCSTGLSHLHKSVITGLANRCAFHASGLQQRKLDSRAHPPYKHPSSKWGRWEPRKKMSELYDYTTEPLPFPKTGGRGPNGRIWNHRRAGGLKNPFYMIDWVRGGSSDGGNLIEKVDMIMDDPNRSGKIALVAGGMRKRWLVATQHMKPGDHIKSSTQLLKTPVRAKEGDSYPLGSLPLGTLVNCVELYPGEGALVARAAGVTAQLVRKMDDTCVVKMPSKREIRVSSNCVATVGRVSNIDHNKRVIGKAGVNRWLGIKPRSGRWHRKTGRFGRKIKGPKAVKVYDEPPRIKAEAKPYTFIYGHKKL